VWHMLTEGAPHGCHLKPWGSGQGRPESEGKKGGPREGDQDRSSGGRIADGSGDSGVGGFGGWIQNCGSPSHVYTKARWKSSFYTWLDIEADGIREFYADDVNGGTWETD